MDAGWGDRGGRRGGGAGEDGILRGRDFVVFDIETVVDAALARPQDLVDERNGEVKFPVAPLHQVVAIAIAEFRREPDGAVTFLEARAGGTAAADERALLQGFWATMAAKEPTFVGFNSRGFDIPVLLHRSLRHGLDAGFFLTSGDKWSSYRQRYAADWHLDLLDALSDYGATRRPSLDLAARLVGAPGKLDTDGGDVARLYAEGRIQAIRAYCVTDVLSTSLVWLSWLRLEGRLTAEQLASTRAQMLSWLDAGAGA
jgi:predicted PolB exonuclease-like 3'-5' exonuclease